MLTPALRTRILIAAAGSTLAAQSLATPVSSVLIKQGDPIGVGQTVADVQGAATNTVGGFLFRVTGSTGTASNDHLWGSATLGPAAILRSSGNTIAGYLQGSASSATSSPFETSFGLGNAGQIAYSSNLGTGATVSNADSMWVDNTPLAVTGDPSVIVPMQRWSFASAPRMASQTGQAWWIGGFTTSTTTTTSQRRGLVRQGAAAPVLFAGEVLPGVTVPISDISSILFDWGLSSDGNHWIVQTSTDPNPVNDKMVVRDGLPLNLGTPGSPLLVKTGEIAPFMPFTPTYSAFSSAAINNAGRFAVSGTAGGFRFLTRDGQALLLENDTIEGATLFGSILDVRMNNTGDVACNSSLADLSLSGRALLFNRRVVIRIGQAVDLDGNGSVDPAAVLSELTSGALAMSERQGSIVRIYYSGRLDLNATPGVLTDDFDAALVAKVCLPDFNNDGGVTVQDIFDFLTAWFSNDPNANINSDAGVTVQDIFDFLGYWFAGCA
jgi:hypothetical protein